jgi:hypothetical protein
MVFTVSSTDNHELLQDNRFSDYLTDDVPTLEAICRDTFYQPTVTAYKFLLFPDGIRTAISRNKDVSNRDQLPNCLRLNISSCK